MFNKSITYILLTFLLFSCKSEYKFTLVTPKKIQVNQELVLTVTEKANMPIDSVQFSIGGKKIASKNANATIDLSNLRLGKHTVTAIIFYQSKTEKVSKPIYVLADGPPALYTYKILNTYPHDVGAYTQGLEYHKGYLYEGTGQNGKSSIRKVELKTGKVLLQVDLDEKYFGEGITIFNDKLYQLTWKGGLGIIYDLNTFDKLGEFKYTKSREGWGFTNNGTQFIKTEGSERIWFLNSESLLEEDYIEAYTNKRKVEKLNELEFMNGKIYANIWQENSILIVNPKNGKIEGVANLDGLKKEILKSQNLTDDDEVLNGIAFDKENNRLFVTGKHWAKLFEIELIKK